MREQFALDLLLAVAGMRTVALLCSNSTYSRQWHRTFAFSLKACFQRVSSPDTTPLGHTLLMVNSSRPFLPRFCNLNRNSQDSKSFIGGVKMRNISLSDGGEAWGLGGRKNYNSSFW